MNRTILLVTAFSITGLLAAEKQIALKDLPPAVRVSVEANAAGAEIKSIVKEVEKGKTLYEVETLAAGKTRDLMIDPNGHVISVEQEVDLASIPPAARTAIEKSAGAGKVTKVEAVTKGSDVAYEASVVSKSGKKREITVAADGSPRK